MQRIHEDPEDRQHVLHLFEDGEPGYLAKLSVLLVDEHVEGDVQHGEGKAVEDGGGQGAVIVRLWGSDIVWKLFL